MQTESGLTPKNWLWHASVLDPFLRTMKNCNSSIEWPTIKKTEDALNFLLWPTMQTVLHWLKHTGVS
jgi:hypothetical protein